MARVLDGIRIADFTAVMAGASGAMFLGDLGADVVKVENVSGRGPVGVPSGPNGPRMASISASAPAPPMANIARQPMNVARGTARPASRPTPGPLSACLARMASPTRLAGSRRVTKRSLDGWIRASPTPMAVQSSTSVIHDRAATAMPIWATAAAARARRIPRPPPVRSTIRPALTADATPIPKMAAMHVPSALSLNPRSSRMPVANAPIWISGSTTRAWVLAASAMVLTAVGCCISLP